MDKFSTYPEIGFSVLNSLTISASWATYPSAGAGLRGAVQIGLSYGGVLVWNVVWLSAIHTLDQLRERLLFLLGDPVLLFIFNLGRVLGLTAMIPLGIACWSVWKTSKKVLRWSSASQSAGKRSTPKASFCA